MRHLLTTLASLALIGAIELITQDGTWFAVAAGFCAAATCVLLVAAARVKSA